MELSIPLEDQLRRSIGPISEQEVFKNKNICSRFEKSLDKGMKISNIKGVRSETLFILKNGTVLTVGKIEDRDNNPFSTPAKIFNVLVPMELNLPLFKYEIISQKERTSVYGNLANEFQDNNGVIFQAQNIYWFNKEGKALKEERITKVKNGPGEAEKNLYHKINLELPRRNQQRYIPLNIEDYEKINFGLNLIENSDM